MLAGVLWAQAAPVEQLLRDGLLALNGNDLPAARVQLEKASRITPRDARIWLALAQTYRKANDAKLAASAAARAASLGADDPVILHGLAIFHTESGNWAEAADFEARYAERAPGDLDASLRAVSLCLQAGQPKRAIQIARQGLASEDRAALRNLLGKALAADGQLPEAARELQQAVRLSPFEEAYHFDLAHALLLRHDFEGAWRALEAARKIFDKSAQIELATGVALYGLRRFGEAIDSFLRAAALAPDVEQPYVFLGRILSQAEARLPEIAEKFAAFAAARPRHFLGKYLEAKAQAALGDPFGRAEALLRESIALNDQFWESHFELGVLLERRRAFADAAAALELAARLHPGNAATHYRLARLYDRLGKPDQAAAARSLHQKYEAQARTAAAASKGLPDLDSVLQ